MFRFCLFGFFFFGKQWQGKHVYIQDSTLSEKIVRALETGSKASLWWDFLVCFTASSN